MKILLKIWPALMPILIYIFWQLVLKKVIARIFKKISKVNQENNVRDNGPNNRMDGKIIDADFIDNFKERGNKKNDTDGDKNDKILSLKNNNFVIILYLSLILAVICIISFAL